MTITAPELVSASARAEEMFSTKAEDPIQSDTANASGSFGVTALLGTITWQGPSTTVLLTDTTHPGAARELQSGDFIRDDSDGQFFRVISVITNVSVQITNPDGLTIPNGVAASSAIDPAVITLSSGAFAIDLTQTMRFRVESGSNEGLSALIDTRDNDTQITLQTGLPSGFTNQDWTIIQEDVFLFISKNHSGAPKRELEVHTLREIFEAQSGPFFFNVIPTRVELLQQTFNLVSVINILGRAIRFYWNRGSGLGTEILQVDYDTFRNVATSAVSVLPFAGIDPFIMDARTQNNSNRFYMVYVTTAGGNAFRQSFDGGQTWGAETLIDDVAATDHNFCECNFDDPQTDREDVQVLQQRS